LLLGRGRWRGGCRCGLFGEERGWEGVAYAAVYEDALLWGCTRRGFALWVGVGGERGRGRGFEYGAEDGGVGEDAAVVDEAEAGEGGLRGRGGLCRGIVLVGFGFGLSVGCQTAADEVLQGDNRGLLGRGDVEVQVGESGTEADGDVKGWGKRRRRKEQRGRAARGRRTGVSRRPGRGG
jgi:hypothetical protein